MSPVAFRVACGFLAVFSAGCSSSDDGGATAADGGVDSSGAVDTAMPAVCGAGAWDHDGNPTTACVPWAECRAGQRVVSAGSATSDRVCAPCGTGTFNDALNATACRAWMTCNAGTRVVTAGTASNDRVCKACEAETYADRPNAPSCKSATACVAGEYELFPTSPTTDRACGSCAAGTFSDTANAKACSAWKTCLPGTYVTMPPSATSDRTCAACASGTFSTSINQASCLPANACPAGTVQTAPGTGTTPPTCAACESGTYCAGGTAAKVPCAGGTFDNDANAATTCVSWSECSPGQFVASAGTALADRTCSACGPSSFSTTKNAASCASWTNCPAGTYVSSPGASTSDRVCSACAPGTFTATANQSACIPVTCTDGFRNGTETDVDCGGSCAVKCADTKACTIGADCVSRVCDSTAKTCTPASCTDTVQNGSETDIDCGGSCSTKCAAGKGCLVGGDCASGACSALFCVELPTLGLAARYNAQAATSITFSSGSNVATWADLSGNGRTLSTATGTPTLGATLINGNPAINFASSKMTTAAFPLTTDVTVFAVFQFRNSGNWGPIAHHGNRDDDWSMEQNGLKASTVMHWQSVNDNSTVELSFAVGTNYVAAGRLSGTGGTAVRYFSATSTAGGTVSTSGTGSTIAAGTKVLYVGGSDINEFSNHYIGELVYYSRAVTDAERDQIIAYLRARWGI